jgi:hypothetical protein
MRLSRGNKDLRSFSRDCGIRMTGWVRRKKKMTGSAMSDRFLHCDNRWLDGFKEAAVVIRPIAGRISSLGFRIRFFGQESEFRKEK